MPASHPPRPAMPVINRFLAFGIHLAISLLVALAAAALISFGWYPGALATVTGVTPIFLLIVGVDVVVGPCLTLLVFDRAKKELKRDLSIIAMLQLIALGVGLQTVFSARPVYLVFAIDHFEAVYATDLPKKVLVDANNPGFATLPFFGPKTIGARLPENVDLSRGILERSQQILRLPLTPRYYVPYPEITPEVSKAARPLILLNTRPGSDNGRVVAIQQRFAARPEPVGFVPVRGGDWAYELTAFVRLDTGEVLEIIDLHGAPNAG